jgi:hypothetical protein
MRIRIGNIKPDIPGRVGGGKTRKSMAELTSTAYPLSLENVSDSQLSLSSLRALPSVAPKDAVMTDIQSEASETQTFRYQVPWEISGS